MNEIKVHSGRKITLENAERIGSGYFSDVYQVGPETVVKVLKIGTKEDAEREIMLSKWAMVNGIPTAISYDVADVNGHPALVYELLGKGSLRDRLAEKPEDLERRTRQYADLLHKIHRVADTQGSLPKIIDYYLTKLDKVTCFTHAEREQARELLFTIPQTDHVVHCDCHVKNIKVVQDELMLIDLETLSRGDPIYDLASAYCAYRCFNEARGRTVIDTFLDIPVAVEQRMLTLLFGFYFEGVSDEDRARNNVKIEWLAYLRVILFILAYEGDTFYDLDLILSFFRERHQKLTDLRLVYP